VRITSNCSATAWFTHSLFVEADLSSRAVGSVQAAVQGIQRELDRKTRELAQLQEEHQESNSALRVEREVYARKIESFEAQLREQQDRAAQLERELSNRPTVEEHEKALQQLQIFKNLEYDTNQDDTSVESILKDRNRKLETDLTKVRTAPTPCDLVD